MPGNIKYDFPPPQEIAFLCNRVHGTALQGFFMQKDYKMFPPSVNWDNIDWSTRRPQMDFPVQVSAVDHCFLFDCTLFFLNFHVDEVK